MILSQTSPQGPNSAASSQLPTELEFCPSKEHQECLIKLINSYTVKVSIYYILSMNALSGEGQAGSSINLPTVTGRLGSREDAVFSPPPLLFFFN